MLVDKVFEDSNKGQPRSVRVACVTRRLVYAKARYIYSLHRYLDTERAG